MDFLDSSFFKSNQCLPTPTEVRALSTASKLHTHPPPVIFEHLNLLVKFGPRVTIAEAQTLWIVRKTLLNEVPVPEVYGCRVGGRNVFIYMQLVQGERLKERWDSLSIAAKTDICNELRTIVASLRRVKQDSSDPFIGMY
jgi:hypothetical protein